MQRYLLIFPACSSSELTTANWNNIAIWSQFSPLQVPLPFFPLGLSGRRGIVIACVCPSVRLSVRLFVRKLLLVRTITRLRFELELITKFAPKMHPGILSAGIENGGHWPWPSKSFWPFWLRILVNSACPCDNSSQILARITKFAPNMHLEIILGSNEIGGSLTLTFKVIWPFRLKKRHSPSLLHTDQSVLHVPNVL